MIRARIRAASRSAAVASVLLAALIGTPPAHAVDASTPTSPATAAVAPTSADQTAPAVPAQDGTDPSAGSSTRTTNDPWSLPDRLIERLDDQWMKNRQVYTDRGSVSIRANAMLLELHAMAALAGHAGSARRDDRIPGLVRLFTTAPVYVTVTKTKRTTASFPHTPAFESVYRADSAHAPLHPSADAIIMRALATAWRARDVAGLPLEDSQRIEQVVGSVARGKWYRAPTRAENQINWNADVYQANLEVNGDRMQLPDYRAHLKWFIDHADRRAYKGGSTNLSRGDGFRYLPQHDGGSANKVDTVEYANLVHSALGFYTAAVRAGMRPLNGKQIAALRAWSRHILFGTWTHSGYLNWDSGLGSARRHIMQYWGFALDSLVRSSGPGALLGSDQQRAYVRYVADQGLELFRRIGWDGTGPLPAATAFDAPNGFPAGTRSPLIAPLRFAVIAASLDVRLPGTTARMMGNTYAHDSEFGRLVVSTPSYNTAVIKPVAQGEGGLEPSRLFDSTQRPLTVLGAGGFGGPAPGLRLQRGGATVLDDQPGTQVSGRVPSVSVAGNRKNRAGTFDKLTAGGTVRTKKSAIGVRHLFSRTAIETTYRVKRGAGTSITMRMPVWGSAAAIELLRGAEVNGKRIKRKPGALLMRGTTIDGGVMLVSFRGLPSRATIVVVRHGRSSRAPQGARELRIRFKASARMTIKRRIAVVASAPQR